MLSVVWPSKMILKKVGLLSRNSSMIYWFSLVSALKALAYDYIIYLDHQCEIKVPIRNKTINKVVDGTSLGINVWFGMSLEIACC